MTAPLPANSMIGIIGGGQLGRMLAIAAARLGYRTTILEPQEDCPASQTANRHIIAAYDDEHGLSELAVTCAVVTYEFENIDADPTRAMAEKIQVYPPVDALEVSQDRLTEKRFLEGVGLAVAPYRDITDAQSLSAALVDFGGRGILKTRRFGYDGKGQIRFRADPDDMSPEDALAELNNTPAILEGFVDFEREISVIGTRGIDGSVICYDPAENVHRDGILATSTVPAAIDIDMAEEAQSLTAALLMGLNYVGTLGLELFVTTSGELIANEFAPRVHNSGHWTEAACAVSQFENHIRAIAGLPVGNTVRHSNCVMENLLGDEIERLPELAIEPNVVFHGYGKKEARPGRKMGHFTRLFPRSHL